MNSGEAIEWCVDYLPEWPTKEDNASKLARPLGWEWALSETTGKVVLDSGKELIFENHSVWSYKKYEV